MVTLLAIVAFLFTAAWRSTRPSLTRLSFLEGHEPLADRRFSELSGVGTIDRAYVITGDPKRLSGAVGDELTRLGYTESFSPRGPSLDRMWLNSAGDNVMISPGTPIILGYHVDAWSYKILPQPDTTTVIVYEQDKRPAWLIELDWNLREAGNIIGLNPTP
ncbi:hypothetical protein EON81_17420 [bacterium]|nr:MAG: hypothetical protein EON81_17420 [bacterium]